MFHWVVSVHTVPAEHLLHFILRSSAVHSQQTVQPYCTNCTTILDDRAAKLNQLSRMICETRLYQRVSCICLWVISQQLLTAKKGRAELLPNSTNQMDFS